MSHDNYYTQSVAQLGDKRQIVAVQDIHTDKGIKLVARGGRIHSGMMQQLLHHKLIPMLDQALTIEGALTTEQLSRDMAQLLKDEPFLGAMVGQLPQPSTPSAVALQIGLQPPLAFKLTVAKEQRPEVYIHSLLLMAIACYLGSRARLAEHELLSLATAALFHDIGILHIDPALLNSYTTLNDDERRHITAHPAIAWLLLKEFPTYAGEIARAVLEHHERLDGSGYPRQLQGEQISRLGQMLAVAEVVASRFDAKGVCKSCHDLEIILKLNSGKLNSTMVVLLSPLLGSAPYPQNMAASSDNGELATSLETLGHLFLAWDQLNHQRKQSPTRLWLEDLYDYADERIQKLRTTLRDTGFDPLHGEDFIAAAEDDYRFLHDVAAILKEAQWQLRDILHEIERRWPQLANELEVQELTEWLAQLQRFIGHQLR